MEESHEQAVVEIEQRQIEETKGLKEEFRKDAEANEAKIGLLERKWLLLSTINAACSLLPLSSGPFHPRD